MIFLWHYVVSGWRLPESRCVGVWVSYTSSYLSVYSASPNISSELAKKVYCTIWSCLECNYIILVPVVLNLPVKFKRPLCHVALFFGLAGRAVEAGGEGGSAEQSACTLTADWQVDHDGVPHEIENITCQLVLNRVMNFFVYFSISLISRYCYVIISTHPAGDEGNVTGVVGGGGGGWWRGVTLIYKCV